MDVAVVRSEEARDLDPSVPTGDLRAIVAADAAFAFDLYHELAAGRQANLFFSPSSAAAALTMAYAGARGRTADEMARVLHTPFAGDRLHAARNRLDLDLRRSDDGEALALHVANALWGHAGVPFEEPFLGTLARHYGAGMHVADFATDPDGVRRAINDWVETATRDKIREMFPAGSIDTLTRLVLANAVYLRAQWVEPFDPAATEPGPFQRLDGRSRPVPMMHTVALYDYAEGDGYQAIRLPYVGDAAMLVVVPEPGRFTEIQPGFTAEFVDQLIRRLGPHQVDLRMPRFGFTSAFGLVNALSALGMPAAFDASAADFGGITSHQTLFLQDVRHQAYVNVDERGTEAAAATGIALRTVAFRTGPPAQLTLDRPFLFAIRHRTTGSLLFLGHVVEPTP
jgi:serpin B